MGQWMTRGRPLATRAGIAIVAIVALGGLAACYPGEISSIQETQVVITTYEKDFDFSSQRTYAMPDTVVEICDVENPDPGLPINCDEESRIDYDHANDATFVARAKQNMDALGYTEIDWETVDENNLPDVALIMMVTVNRWTAVTYWGCGGYWGWWGWYPPGWGCGYPTATSWEQGTLITDMLDPSGASNETIPSVWSGAVNSVLSNSSATNVNLAVSGIDQAFDQSKDYLMVQ
jgi:hypothetical protein